MKMSNENRNIIIKELILSVINFKVDTDDITDDTDLIAQKIIDSISFIKLVNQLEKTFNIEFEISELSIENFRSIKTISAKVNK